jgi:hypothetical protein
VIAVRSGGMITILSALVSLLSFRFRSRASLELGETAPITGYSMTTVQEIFDTHSLGGCVELAESAIKKPSECTDGGGNKFGDVDRFQVKAFPGRQSLCVRERSTPPGHEVAAAVTCSHPTL